MGVKYECHIMVCMHSFKTQCLSVYSAIQCNPLSWCLTVDFCFSYMKYMNANFIYNK